jgi:hypothetical protein
MRLAGTAHRCQERLLDLRRDGAWFAAAMGRPSISRTGVTSVAVPVRNTSLAEYSMSR